MSGDQKPRGPEPGEETILLRRISEGRIEFRKVDEFQYRMVVTPNHGRITGISWMGPVESAIRELARIATKYPNFDVIAYIKPLESYAFDFVGEPLFPGMVRSSKSASAGGSSECADGIPASETTLQPAS